MNLNNITFTPLLETLRIEKIPDEKYFSSKYSEYISNSRLSLINPEQDNDPEAFFEGLSKHSKYSDSLLFGSAVHELVLQSELFELCESVDRPTAKMGFMADELYNSYLEYSINSNTIIDASDKIGYYKGKINKDRIDTIIRTCSPYWESRKYYEKSLNQNITPIYLDPKGREKVKQCVSALGKNQSIQNLLHPEGLIFTPISENEQAILLDILVSIEGKESFILKLKSKLDNYTIDQEINTAVVNDIKTIGKIVSEFNNNFQKFCYYRELSLYSWLLSLVVKKYYGIDNCTIKSNCLIVSTIPNYYTKIYSLTKADFIKGWEEFKYLLKLVAYHYSNGYRFK